MYFTNLNIGNMLISLKSISNGCPESEAMPAKHSKKETRLNKASQSTIKSNQSTIKSKYNEVKSKYNKDKSKYIKAKVNLQ